jgi:hypothetical protein
MKESRRKPRCGRYLLKVDPLRRFNDGFGVLKRKMETRLERNAQIRRNVPQPDLGSDVRLQSHSHDKPSETRVIS